LALFSLSRDSPWGSFGAAGILFGLDQRRSAKEIKRNLDAVLVSSG
jgi:phosphomannomutase